MRSVGIDLQPWVDQGLLRFHAARPTQHGLEMHLAMLHKIVNEFKPAVVVLDPISNLASTAAMLTSTNAMLVRLIDFLKMQGITALFTHLTNMTSAHTLEQTDVGVSSLVDTWILLRDVEWGGRRTRALFVLKSRGMAHSHDVREFVLSDRGIELRQAMVGTEDVIHDGTAPGRGRRGSRRAAAGAAGTDANGAHR
jgi:circadian clock protein KaiC